MAKPGTAELDDERSIIETAKNNPAALAILYERHYAAIAGFVRHRVGNEHEADDIISDVFLAMVKNLPRYRFRGIPFRIWLFRIATSQLSRWAKQRRRQASRQLAMEVDGKSIEPRKTLDTEMVEMVLATLPHRLQTVLSLHYLEGMTIADMASVVRCSEGTIKSRLHDARILMRERLEKRGFTDDIR